MPHNEMKMGEANVMFYSRQNQVYIKLYKNRSHVSIYKKKYATSIYNNIIIIPCIYTHLKVKPPIEFTFYHYFRLKLFLHFLSTAILSVVLCS